MSYYQYRIIYNGADSGVLDEYPAERWDKICRVMDNRGGKAVFYRRLITDADILPWLIDTTGYIKNDDMVICPWEVLAGVEE
jgi:hypothetical protein